MISTMKGQGSKRIRIAVILLAAMVLIITLYQLRQKTAVIWYVERHFDELTQYAENMMQNGTNGETDTYGRCSVTYWADDGMVEFITGGSGLGSATVYRGIYYSANDLPLGFQGMDVTYTADGAGWKWSESDGDNWEYTERILDHWYWFEMHF